VAHPQEVRETPPPVSPIRPQLRFLKLILVFHQIILSNFTQRIEALCLTPPKLAFIFNKLYYVQFFTKSQMSFVTLFPPISTPPNAKARSAARAGWATHRSTAWFSWEQHRGSGFVLQIGGPKAKLQLSFFIHFHEEKQCRCKQDERPEHKQR